MHQLKERKLKKKPIKSLGITIKKMIAQIIKKIMAKEVRYGENQKQWFGRNLQNRGYNINNQIDHLGGIHKGYPIFG